MGLGETVVDVAAQGLERQPPLEVPLGAGDLGAVQAARHADPDAQRAELGGHLDGPLHGAAEGHALGELEGDGLGDELGLDLGPVDLVDLDVDLAAHALLDLLLEPVHLGALLADDDARAARGDGDGELLARALEVDPGHARVLQPLLQLFPQLEVLVEELLVLLLGEPAGLPVLVEAYPETYGMNFLTQRSPP